MNQLEHDDFIQTPPHPNPPLSEFRQTPSDPRLPSTRSQPSSSQRSEGEIKDGVAARKLQKADREKLRRDRLNEQFIELGNVLDPDRPKNDKATILTDTIQLLKDLTSQVNKLKSEYASLTEEARELTQEKNDLREEKSSLKSDIENLNVQYQQRMRTMFPWAAMDHSVVMAPPSYPYPVPMPLAPGPIPMHPHMQPYPFYGNQNPGVIPNPCSTFVPYITPSTLVEQQSQQYVSPIIQPGSRSNVSGKQDSRNKSSGESKIGKSEDSNDVATNLELKTPGSATDQDSGQGQSQRSVSKENNITERSSSSRCSSSRSVQDSSSNSIVSSREPND
ncbi:Basic helix-loop-helix transcription factor [Trema orientale]|uniref:Basic helix-loop-helix transcription factor n=1 Tax=Trema orientale TaxID=63057 RepID=A0A2P5ED01_TREOI|nr:Basic helix-loop-helix transcription factor [Trema orientale]